MSNPGKNGDAFTIHILFHLYGWLFSSYPIGNVSTLM